MTRIPQVLAGLALIAFGVSIMAMLWVGWLRVRE
jgi:hypothetical protein